MEHEAWPSPETPSREPLPRVEDLPVAEQGYEQESVKAAFDSFYRHAAQLDAALRTLEAVDSFHRQAAALRSDLRSLRAAGWTQQSWTAPPTYGYGVRAPREGIPPSVLRIGGEVAFLVAVAVVLGVAQLAWWAILLAMFVAFAIVCVIEWLAGREQYAFARPGEPAPVLPVVEAQRIDDTGESESSGWTAFEEAQEPSDAMTMVAPPPPEAVVVEPAEDEAEPEQPDEPEPEPEPELPPAAEETPQAEEQERKHWWQRRSEPDEEAVEPEPEPPRHVRVLPPDEGAVDAPEMPDPWEAAPEDVVSGEPDEETEEPAVVVEEEPRRRFRRR
jgi:hypothetical protein